MSYKARSNVLESTMYQISYKARCLKCILKHDVLNVF